jgi:ATP-dependent Clp protease adapter protein ClpS
METWNVIVWNDEVNLAAYVAYVFRRLLNLTRSDATSLMLDIHRGGSATVAAGAREHVELTCFRLRVHGLDATLERA